MPPPYEGEGIKWVTSETSIPSQSLVLVLTAKPEQPREKRNTEKPKRTIQTDPNEYSPQQTLISKVSYRKQLACQH